MTTNDITFNHCVTLNQIRKLLPRFIMAGQEDLSQYMGTAKISRTVRYHPRNYKNVCCEARSTKTRKVGAMIVLDIQEQNHFSENEIINGEFAAIMNESQSTIAMREAMEPAKKKRKKSNINSNGCNCSNQNGNNITINNKFAMQVELASVFDLQILI